MINVLKNALRFFLIACFIVCGGFAVIIWASQNALSNTETE